jgi:hypothetical protein
MSGKLISIKVDVTKLDKTKFFKSDKGAVYADLDVWINEDEDEDWKKVSINQSQTKEERDAKAQKTFCGNGKLLFGWEDGGGSTSPASAEITEEDVPF